MLQQRRQGSIRHEFSREGTGGMITITASSREEVQREATVVVDAIDYLRSPHVALGPVQTPDGEWLMQVAYYGLD